MILASTVNSVLTIGCLVVLVTIGIITAVMVRAMKRDEEKSDEETERELRDWEDD
jgi:heme/copper-type cytochrome/quinol oxidase subunit 2